MKKELLLSILFAGLFINNIFAQLYWQPDLNGDEFVNFEDFAAIAENWQMSGSGLVGDLDNSKTVNENDLMRFAYYWLSEFEWKNADFNHDGIVNFFDFATLAKAWPSDTNDANWYADCDFNGDNQVDIIDLDSFAQQWLRQSPANVIYVNVNAAPGGDGASWDNAFVYLQDAIAAADSGWQIWVAEGVYKPDANSTFPAGTGLRTSTFQLPQGTAIYGGFPPGGWWQHRKPDIYKTILSGDIGIEGNKNDNCYNVVVGANDVTLDGFIIADGNATGTGDRARARECVTKM